MRPLRVVFRDLFRREDFERDLGDELGAFLEMAADEHRRRGMSEADAWRAARLELGGLDQARERLRAERVGVLLETIWQDVRYALRVMRRQPGFTAVAVLTLALGIGANTAVMSAVQSVLLAPLPFEDAERLVRLRVMQTDATGHERELSLVPAHFTAVRERSRLLERVAAQRFHNLTLIEGDEADRVVGIGVSDQWTETLGVRPVLGRPFSPQEQREGDAAQVVLIGYGLWQRRFGGDPGVLGRPVRLNRRSFVVIGVMPAQFRYPYEADVWFPVSIPPTDLAPGDLNAAARLRPGVTHAQLEAELAALSEDLAREFPQGNPFRLVGVPLRTEFARDPNRAMAALAGAVAFVLLLATVNLVMLLTARGYARRPEMALRAAVGASRWRQVRQLLTEAMLLAALGGAAGVAGAAWASQWMGVLIPARLSEVIQQVHVDGSVLAVSAFLVVATGLVVGAVPALRITDHAASGMLRDGGRPGASVGRRALDLFVAGQAALAMVLLAAAALMTQNVAHLLAADIGYDTAGLVRINLSLTDPSYAAPGRRTATIREILDRVAAVPGVASTGATNLQPVPRVRANLGTSLEPDTMADPSAPRPVVNRRLVTAGYFQAVGVRLVAGRRFTDLDGETGQPVAILNDAAAARFWPGQDPIGRRVRAGVQADAPWLTVVGIVSNMGEPDEAMGETLYQPYAQATGTLPADLWVTRSVSLMVRSDGDRVDLVEGVRQAIRQVDPTLPLFDIADMETALAEPLAAERLGAMLFALFGLFGLTMAVLGTYGVVAFSTSSRMPEFAVRLALGAAPATLLRRVMADGLRPVATGLALGLGASLLASPLLASVLTEVSPRDPLTLAVVAAILLAAAAAACLGPGLRVTRVNPVGTLRNE